MRRSAATQDALEHPVDHSARAASLVREASTVADPADHEPSGYPSESVLVARKPRDRTDRARHEDEAKSAAEPALGGQAAREKRRDSDTGEIVVGERGMANVSRDEEFLVSLTRHEIFPVR